MRYRELRPAAALRESIECVWIASGRGAEPGVETIVPDGCPELIFHLGERFAGGNLEPQPRAVLIGPSSQPFRVGRPAGRVRSVGVRFRPGGLHAFVATPLHEFAEEAVDASAAFGAGLNRLSERMADATDDRTLVELVGGFLLDRRRPIREELLVRPILASRGRVGVKALARLCGVSARQLERRFKAAVGLSPKRLARLVRFQEVLRRSAGSAPDWVGVALDCGYFDQAHLLADFREFTGTSPSRYSRAGLAGNFVAPDRLDAFFGD